MLDNRTIPTYSDQYDDERSTLQLSLGMREIRFIHVGGLIAIKDMVLFVTDAHRIQFHKNGTSVPYEISYTS
jgi:hypothetical protein